MNSGLLKEMDEETVRMKNPLVLAYIGDTVYDLYMRTKAVKESDAPVNILNRKVTGQVNARAQSAAVDKLMEGFSEAEADIFRRGRNAKCGTVPKNMPVGDYHRATGLEAVVGYLFLTGQQMRLEEIFSIIEAQGGV